MIDLLEEFSEEGVDVLEVRFEVVGVGADAGGNMVESVGEDCEDAVNEVAVVAFLLACELRLEDLVALLHDLQEHLADVQLFEGVSGGQLEDVRVCLTDEGQDPAGVFVGLYGEFVGIHEGFSPERSQLVEGLKVVEVGEDLMREDAHTFVGGLQAAQQVLEITVLKEGSLLEDVGCLKDLTLLDFYLVAVEVGRDECKNL